MGWTTPTLREVREMVRDDVTSALSGAVLIGNSVLRVISDATAGLTHLTLRYISWLSKQQLPDTAESEWLDRHGDIWLKNSDGSIGRKAATFATGSVTFTGTNGFIIPSGTILISALNVRYELTDQITVGPGATAGPVRALSGGVQGNLAQGDSIALLDTIPGIDTSAVVVLIDGGIDTENDDDLRTRILLRIQRPPMGGDSDDYVQWALAVPGVTRAWSSVEMGIGTVTVRFMMDVLRAGQQGFPNGSDVLTVKTYLQTVRPVSVKDLFVVAPIPFPIDFRISDLDIDADDTRATIELNVRDMLLQKAAPARQINGVQHEAQTIYAAWVSEAISASDDVNFFSLTMEDAEMPYNGALAVLGTITYDNF